MKNYLFVLGRDPELSILEIISYLETYNSSWELKSYNKEVSIFSIKDFNFARAIARLGGTIKIGVVISEGRFENLDVYDGVKNKLSYCTSVYGKSSNTSKFEKYLASWFKKNKIRATRRKRDKISLTPRDLGDNTIEFLLYKNYIARSAAVSNPSEYKKRDKERPRNDFLRSISIRLAKILINLCKAKGGKVLLDPFCGMGVILEEALLANVNVIGIEKDSKIAKMARKNIEFFAEKHRIDNWFRIYNEDSINIDKILNKNSVDCVVSEPYMGPYLKEIPSRESALDIAFELRELYFKFFNSLRKVLKGDGNVVIVLPVFKTKSGQVRINYGDIFKKCGFEIVNLHEELRFPIVYKKERSIVEREIYVLGLVKQ